MPATADEVEQELARLKVRPVAALPRCRVAVLLAARCSLLAAERLTHTAPCARHAWLGWKQGCCAPAREACLMRTRAPWRAAVHVQFLCKCNSDRRPRLHWHRSTPHVVLASSVALGSQVLSQPRSEVHLCLVLQHLVLGLRSEWEAAGVSASKHACAPRTRRTRLCATPTTR